MLPGTKKFIELVGYSTFKEAWENCPRGDWMLEVAFYVMVDDRKLTLSKGLCANIVRHLMENQRSIEGVDTAIAYGKGLIHEEELEEFLDGAVSAAFAAAAKKENQKQTADICREVLTEEVFEKLNLK